MSRKKTKGVRFHLVVTFQTADGHPVYIHSPARKRAFRQLWALLSTRMMQLTRRCKNRARSFLRRSKPNQVVDSG